ncbi:MAG: hypothetical protein QM756_07760 [Polyangiaceae bacterium]
MSIITPALKASFLNEGFMILPSVISADTLAILREECSYSLGYVDSLLDARGVEMDDLSQRGKRYFIQNQYRRSERLWEFILARSWRR